ncbi:MAG: hypothetical protein GY847_32670 [Proteobacteria bacterium]|nr:hypothetical protein [Pseudomonadota bacterium]
MPDRSLRHALFVANGHLLNIALMSALLAMIIEYERSATFIIGTASVYLSLEVIRSFALLYCLLSAAIITEVPLPNNRKGILLLDSSIGRTQECFPAYCYFFLRVGSASSANKFATMHEYAHFRYRHFIFQFICAGIFLQIAIELVDYGRIWSLLFSVPLIIIFLKDLFRREELQADNYAAEYIQVPAELPALVEDGKKTTGQSKLIFNPIKLARLTWKYSKPNKGIKRVVCFCVWFTLALVNNFYLLWVLIFIFYVGSTADELPFLQFLLVVYLVLYSRFLAELLLRSLKINTFYMRAMGTFIYSISIGNLRKWAYPSWDVRSRILKLRLVSATEQLRKEYRATLKSSRMIIALVFLVGLYPGGFLSYPKDEESSYKIAGILVERYPDDAARLLDLHKQALQDGKIETNVASYYQAAVEMVMQREQASAPVLSEGLTEDFACAIMNHFQVALDANGRHQGYFLSLPRRGMEVVEGTPLWARTHVESTHFIAMGDNELHASRMPDGISFDQLKIIAADELLDYLLIAVAVALLNKLILKRRLRRCVLSHI